MIENASIRAVEQELRRLNAASAEPGEPTTLRTRVLTHMAWVPAEWESAARSVLDGLGERNPSRTIMLVPDPGADRDALDAEVDLRCFAGGGPGGTVCSEVIAIWLRGRCAQAPASVVQPLLVSDLPVFLRWRGSLPYGEPPLHQLVGVADRLVVNSHEWADPARDQRLLGGLFDQVIVSDLAWARLEPWRAAIANLWPAVAQAAEIAVRGPYADAQLLAGWLRSRLDRDVRLEHDPAEELEEVRLDGEPVLVARFEHRTPSELLSDQLEIYGRDAVYEAAVVSD